MDLILWRHAEAEDNASSDLARRLTPRGERQAARMASWLKLQFEDPANRRSHWHVIASPAVRAQQTAAALKMPIETINAIAPDASAEAILRAAKWPEGKKNIIVVGHEPTLGLVAGALVDEADGYVPFKKGAVRWFRASMQDGKARVVLVASATPKTIDD
jgi:phosphohistidine phosphatase